MSDSGLRRKFNKLSLKLDDSQGSLESFESYKQFDSGTIEARKIII